MRTFVTAAFATLGLASLPVLAAEDSGFYAGAGLGFSNIETESIEVVDGEFFKFDSDDVAWKIFGGWRLNKYIAFELDYVDLGSNDDTVSYDVEVLPPPAPLETIDFTTTVDVTAFVPYVIATYPFGIFEVSGKVGYAFWDADLDVCASDGTGAYACEGASDDGEDFAWGLGAGVTVFDNLNVKVEYEGIEIEDADVSVWWLTGAWRF